MLNKAKGCAFGVLFGTLLKVIVTILKVLIQILAKVLVFLGLWIPLVYAIFGVILFYGFDFDPFDFSLYSTLYLSGAIACIVCSLIIGVRNLFIHPTESIFEGYRHPIWERNREENIEKEEDAKFLSKKERKKLSPPDSDDFKTYKSKPLDANFLPPRPSNSSINNNLPPRPINKAPFINRTINNPEFIQNNPSNFIPNNNFVADNIVPNYNYMGNPPPQFIDTTTTTIEKPSVYFSKIEPELLIHEYANRFEIFKIKNNTSVLDRIEYK